MPSPAPDPMNVAAALQHLQRQVDQLVRRPASGGGVLGRAGVYCSYPSSMNKDTTYDPTDMGLYRDIGDHGVSVAGTVMTIQPGLYVVTCPAGFAASGSSGGTEVHTCTAFSSPGVGASTAVSFRNNDGWCPGAAIFNLSTAATYTPQVGFSTSVTGAQTFRMFANEWDFEFLRLSA